MDTSNGTSPDNLLHISNYTVELLKAYKPSLKHITLINFGEFAEVYFRIFNSMNVEHVSSYFKNLKPIGGKCTPSTVLYKMLNNSERDQLVHLVIFIGGKITSEEKQKSQLIAQQLKSLKVTIIVLNSATPIKFFIDIVGSKSHVINIQHAEKLISSVMPLDNILHFSGKVCQNYLIRFIHKKSYISSYGCIKTS